MLIQEILAGKEHLLLSLLLGILNPILSILLILPRCVSRHLIYLPHLVRVTRETQNFTFCKEKCIRLSPVQPSRAMGKVWEGLTQPLPVLRA